MRLFADRRVRRHTHLVLADQVLALGLLAAGIGLIWWWHRDRRR